MTERKLIQSYVIEKYFVSTAFRKSSARVIDPGYYFETIVWEWNKETKHRGKMIDTHVSGRNEEAALKNHANICLNLIKEKLS
jgi:hypothetical protein